MTISVLILTRNEEQDLPGCLRSVAWSDDIHVYDSLSEDRTIEIARDFGATITSRAFDDWATHQNWGLAHIPFKHRWVFYLDADERVSDALAANLVAAARSASDCVAYRVRRRDFMGNVWLRHCQATTHYLRLFRPDRMRYERLVNPVSLPDGPVGDVAGDLDHYPFSKGMAHWIARHNGYSLLEAQQLLAPPTSGGLPEHAWWKAFTAATPHERRFHQKEVFQRLPLQPLVRFLLLYVVRGGFLDGRAGLTYATLQAIYQYMIVLEMRELRAGASLSRACQFGTAESRALNEES
jgi:hypothetical protein